MVDMPSATEGAAGESDAFPLELGPNHSVRWRAVSVDHSRVSRSFKFWVAGKEAYVCQRKGVGNMKVSLHESGDAHAAFQDHETSEQWLRRPGSRYIDAWRDPAPFHPGWVEIFGVVTPESELRAVEELATGEEVTQFEVQEGSALMMLIFRLTDPGFVTEVTFDPCIPFADFTVPGCQYRLVALLGPWGPDEQEWASRSRMSTPASRSNSLVPPGGINLNSPSARLLKLVDTTKGGRWFLDLAASESP